MPLQIYELVSGVWECRLGNGSDITPPPPGSGFGAAAFGTSSFGG